MPYEGRGCNNYPAIQIAADAVYSFRRVSTRSPKCCNVRRSSDNLTMDIGWSGDTIDLAQLLYFVGTGSGFVTTWYDQGGLYDAKQLTAAAQPTIVNAGTVSQYKGRIVMSQTSSQYLSVPPGVTGSGNTNWSVNYVAAQKGTNNGRILTSQNPNSNWLLGWWGNREDVHYFNGGYLGGLAASTAPQVYTAIATAGQPPKIFRNSLPSLAGNVVNNNSPFTNGASLYTNGSTIGSEGSDCYFAELAIWNSTISDALRISIETNQKPYYSI